MYKRRPFTSDCATSLVGLGPVVPNIIRLMSSLMTNWLTVVAKVFSNTLRFLLQKCEIHIFSAKTINVFAILQDRNFNVTSCLRTTSLSFEQLGIFTLHICPVLLLT